ncbi:hypothetical protein A2Z22_03705 [Candidatus Woesebacteria bacterium RBG_16_34_12]|uniref:Uncharacterized protein n=1 Tax=Candidatus Woesebacteria bacterium RBG_16_34_12 TaxID=1802480 RepID=A0A1F7X798_9BACT|nr:MAG: hypothetical protein A2Z22_03705 [Candidatus Woesebacteria bacterium RBG_16_34_12]
MEERKDSITQEQKEIDPKKGFFVALIQANGNQAQEILAKSFNGHLDSEQYIQERLKAGEPLAICRNGNNSCKFQINPDTVNVEGVTFHSFVPGYTEELEPIYYSHFLGEQDPNRTYYFPGDSCSYFEIYGRYKETGEEFKAIVYYLAYGENI